MAAVRKPNLEPCLMLASSSILNLWANQRWPAVFLMVINVISEVCKGRRADAGPQCFWATAVREDTPLFIAAVTIGELRRG